MLCNGTDILKDISPDPAHLAQCNFEYGFQYKPHDNRTPQSLDSNLIKPTVFSPSDDMLAEKQPFVDLVKVGWSVISSPPTTPLGIFGTVANVAGPLLEIASKKKKDPLYGVLGSLARTIGSGVGTFSNFQFDLSTGPIHPTNLESKRKF